MPLEKAKLIISHALYKISSVNLIFYGDHPIQDDLFIRKSHVLAGSIFRGHPSHCRVTSDRMSITRADEKTRMRN